MADRSSSSVAQEKRKSSRRADARERARSRTRSTPDPRRSHVRWGKGRHPVAAADTRLTPDPPVTEFGTGVIAAHPRDSHRGSGWKLTARSEDQPSHRPNATRPARRAWGPRASSPALEHALLLP